MGGALGSASIVLLTSINIWLIARAIEPGAISLLEVLVVNPIIVFVALALPLAPGGLGVRQGAFCAHLSACGRQRAALGLAVGILQQALGYIVSLPGGILWMPRRAQEQRPAGTLPHHSGACAGSDASRAAFPVRARPPVIRATTSLRPRSLFFPPIPCIL